MIENKIRVKAYLMEAAGIGGFVMLAGLITIFFEHPAMPGMQGFMHNYPLLRRIPLGILLGAYTVFISLRFSKTSGAFVNPAVTLGMYRTGSISFADTLGYIVAQFAGACIGALLLKLSFYDLFSHPNIHFGITRPQPPHESVHAFIAEFIISFIVMATILLFSSYKKLEKKLPFMMGIWIGLFLIVELPFSGMSLNPARSFAGALAANKWGHLWIYFAAPLSAMLLATELFYAWKKRKVKQSILKPDSQLQMLKNYPTASA